MITLDASVIIALLNPRDPHHEAAAEYLRCSAAEELVIHSLSLAEVLVGRAKSGRGQEMLTDLEAIGLRVADQPGDESLRPAYLGADSSGERQDT